MKKGFTLLELLIVIGILAILAAVTVLVINPAEILRKARDSRRIADLDSIYGAINYYVTNTSSPSIGDTAKVYAYAHTGLTSVTCDGRTSTLTASQAVTSTTGWIPVPLGYLTEGAPLGAWPIDPSPVVSGTKQNYYVYLPVSTTSYTFEVAANMESTYYSKTGTGDVESTDGGALDTVYEKGIGWATDFTASSTCFGTSP